MGNGNSRRQEGEHDKRFTSDIKSIEDKEWSHKTSLFIIWQIHSRCYHGRLMKWQTKNDQHCYSFPNIVVIHCKEQLIGQPNTIAHSRCEPEIPKAPSQPIRTIPDGTPTNNTPSATSNTSRITALSSLINSWPQSTNCLPSLVQRIAKNGVPKPNRLECRLVCVVGKKLQTCNRVLKLVIESSSLVSFLI